MEYSRYKQKVGENSMNTFPADLAIQVFVPNRDEEDMEVVKVAEVVSIAVLAIVAAGLGVYSRVGASYVAAGICRRRVPFVCVPCRGTPPAR